MDDNDDRNDADRLRETGVMSNDYCSLRLQAPIGICVNKFQCIEQKAEGRRRSKLVESLVIGKLRVIFLRFFGTTAPHPQIRVSNNKETSHLNGEIEITMLVVPIVH